MKSSTIQTTLFILEEFHKRADNTLDAYDKFLLEELNVGTKQLGRWLEDIANYENSNIIEIKVGRKKAYKLLKPIDLFIETFENSDDIGWFFNMAHDADPEIFKELEKYTNENKDIYKFKNTPFEDVSTLEAKETFKMLKRAVQAREYIKVKFNYEDEEYDNLKALKLIFMDNNWYIAYVNKDDLLKFGRISFIEKASYATKTTSFQPSSVKKQMIFLDMHLQNSMTLYGEKIKTAIIKATPNISKYFQKDMKIFLSTQKYKETLDDGSVIFSIDYTQELEILPFIQKWLPDLVILEPQELKEAYKTKLQETLENHN